MIAPCMKQPPSCGFNILLGIGVEAGRESKVGPGTVPILSLAECMILVFL